MAKLKLFTYNLRVDVPQDGRNSFANRRDLIRTRFPAYKAGLVGFQETVPHMRRWLMEAFPDYEVCGLGREADLQGESNPIAYRRELFDLAGLDQFWLSDTPDLPGSRFATDQSSCPRLCTVATLFHRETGKLLRFYNTHLDHEGPTAQAQGLSLIWPAWPLIMPDAPCRLFSPAISTPTRTAWCTGAPRALRAAACPWWT